MAPSTTHITSQLRQLIYYHLDNNLVRNALFLAGRLSAYEPRSPEAAYLLATCQFQSGQYKAAWDSTRLHATRGNHLGCCYIYAQASLELGRFVEGITALERSKSLWQSRNTWNQHNETRRQHLPDAAAVYSLEGKLFKAHKDLGKAVDCWEQALKLNPFMWDAFLGLCDSGAKIAIPNIYKITPDMVAMLQAMQRSENSSVTSLDKASTSSIPLQTQPTNNINHFPPSADPFTSSQPKANGMSYGNNPLWERLNGSKVSVNAVSTIVDNEGIDTPATQGNWTEDGSKPWEPPPAPSRKARNADDIAPEYASLPPPKMRAGSVKSRIRSKADLDDAAVLQDPPPPPAPPTKRTISGQAAQTSTAQNGGLEGARRSVRLLNTARPTTAAGSKISSLASSLGLKEGRDIKKAKAPGVKGRLATASTVGRVVSGNRNRAGSTDAMDVDSKESRPAANGVPPVPAIPQGHQKSSRTESNINKDIEALNTLLDLFARIAAAHLALTRYDCQLAILNYNALPSSQRETPYILAQIGKAYYEQASYSEAEKFFIRVKTLCPSRLEDMEVYSTVLWHMKNEVELAYLAHELIETERLSPQAWCAIGNSFSLQREHDQALKCFRRATQIDPQFAYGFTLQGHEYVANEEFEKALDAYRCAVGADGRHYNAWYGLGKVYEKMGKWEIAEQHYRTAVQINPTNAVLVCCIGVVLEKLKKPNDALLMYGHACALAPGSALSRFKKARCLMGLGRPKEALVELKVLKDVAPDEANVHFLLGRLYKMLRMRGEAVRCFTMALNLDPKVGLCLLSGREGGEVVLTCDKLRLHNSSKTQWRAWTMMMKRKKRMARCRSLNQDVGQRQICSVCWRCPI
jgi:anaphase-promoting complex subunit 3